MVQVTVAVRPNDDRLEITIEDNGTGLKVPTDMASNPFYTTKDGKRTGLGISLFQAAAERAAGSLTLGTSEWGGLKISANMQLSHIDRSPLGDVAATLSSIVCTNPEIDLRCRFCTDGTDYIVRAGDVMKETPVGVHPGLAVARRVSERIKAGLAALPMNE